MGYEWTFLTLVLLSMLYWRQRQSRRREKWLREEYRRAEKERQTLFDIMPLPAFVIDGAMRVRKANLTGAALAGLKFESFAGSTPGQVVQCVRCLGNPENIAMTAACAACPVRGTTIGQVLQCSLANPRECGRAANCASCPIHKAMLQAMQQRGGLLKKEVELLRRTSQGRASKNYQIHLTSVTFDNDAAVLMIVEDIGERVRLLRQLEVARREAEAAAHAKSEFLAHMSHEIRTPMNAILGFAEIMQGEIAEERHQEYLAAISSSGRALLKLINDILDLSKIEAGKLELHCQPVDLRSLCGEIEQIFRWQVRERGLELRLRIASSVKAVLFDEVRLRQILLNLVGNAVKFTETGWVGLSVDELENKTPGRIALVFSIEDTGIGIPARHRQSIFEPFEQQQGQSAAKYGGTGLGLAITRRLVQMMGGNIALDSTVGKGTTFRVTFPDVAVTSEASKTEEAAPIDAGALKILIAEDTPHNLMLFAAHLKNTSHVADTAENGRIALEKFKAGGYDIVLMDMSMPVMDGYEATREIRRWEKERRSSPTPIIAITAHAMAGDVQKCLQAGCDAHLPKPFKKAELLKVLAEHGHPRLPAAEAGSRTSGVRVFVDRELQQIIPEFLDLTRQDVESLRAALGRGDFAAIRRIGHTLKGSGGGYGFDEITRLGRSIEEAGKARDAGEATEKVEELSEYLRNLSIIYR